MKARFTRLFSVLALAMLGLLLIASPVLAIGTPDDLEINSVYVYHHCLETNDQLYLVEYYIDYDPANPDENITEAYLGRLMDGVDELGVIAPYSYYDEGYDKGIFAIYFSASDAPSWNGAYTIKLVGNPTLAWDAAVPSISVSTFDWSSSTSIADTQNELTARILYVAEQLELAWGVDNVNMVDSTIAGTYLSIEGEAYFTNAILNIQAMAPKAFAGGVTQPEWDYKEATTGYADDRADSVIDTPLDMTEAADEWGVSRMWMSSLCYILGGILILYCILSPTGNYRPLILLSTPLIIAGGYLGMLPLMATVLLGFAAFALTIFTLFYHPSSV